MVLTPSAGLTQWVSNRTPVTVSAPTAFMKWVKDHGHTDHETGNQYSNTMTSSGGRCPPQLDNQASCHTEQKFADDLIKWNRETEGGAKGKKFKLKGELPPCPNCHGAMMRAAQETGAELSYEWEQPKGTKNKMTYKGDADRNVKVSARGDKAKELKGVYNHKEQGTWGTDRKASHNLWGYESDTAARQKYQEMRDERFGQMKDEKATAES